MDNIGKAIDRLIAKAKRLASNSKWYVLAFVAGVLTRFV